MTHHSSAFPVFSPVSSLSYILLFCSVPSLPLSTSYFLPSFCQTFPTSIPFQLLTSFLRFLLSFLPYFISFPPSSLHSLNCLNCVGVDDGQMAIFEIMDGDLMATSAFGYIFATVALPVGELFRGNELTLALWSFIFAFYC